MVILAWLCIAYFVITEALDWTGRMEIIKKYLPRFASITGSRGFRLLLLLLAIGLLVRIGTEPKQPAGSKVSSQAPAPVPTVPIETKAPCSPVTLGSGNTVTANCQDSSKTAAPKTDK